MEEFVKWLKSVPGSQHITSVPAEVKKYLDKASDQDMWKTLGTIDQRELERVARRLCTVKGLHPKLDDFFYDNFKEFELIPQVGIMDDASCPTGIPCPHCGKKAADKKTLYEHKWISHFEELRKEKLSFFRNEIAMAQAEELKRAEKERLPDDSKRIITMKFTLMMLREEGSDLWDAFWHYDIVDHYHGIESKRAGMEKLNALMKIRKQIAELVKEWNPNYANSVEDKSKKFGPDYINADMITRTLADRLGVHETRDFGENGEILWLRPTHEWEFEEAVNKEISRIKLPQ